MPNIKQSAIHEATIEDESVGGIRNAKRREVASERRRIIEVNPSATLKANKATLKEKVDEYKVELLGKRKRKSKKWAKEVDPNVLLDGGTASKSDKLPSANIMKLLYGHTANYYQEKGILSASKDVDATEPSIPQQNMSYAFDGSSLICMGLLFEELIAHYTKDFVDEDDLEAGLGLDLEDHQLHIGVIKPYTTPVAKNDNVGTSSQSINQSQHARKFESPRLGTITKTHPSDHSDDDLSLASDPDEEDDKRSMSIPSIRSNSVD